MKKLAVFLKLCMVAVFVLPIMFVIAACGGGKKDEEKCDCGCDTCIQMCAPGCDCGCKDCPNS